MAEKNTRIVLNSIQKKYLWTEYDGEDCDPNEGLTQEEIEIKEKEIEERFKEGFEYIKELTGS